MAKRCVEQWINLARCGASDDPATRVDPADIAAIAAGKRAEISKETFVPSEHLSNETGRRTVPNIPEGWN